MTGEAWHNVIRRLRQVQYPQRCNPLTTLIYELPLYGFGSVVNYGVSALSFSLLQGQTYVPSAWSLPGYTSEAICGRERTLHCFFAPVTNCTDQDDDQISHRPSRIVPVRPDPYPSAVPLHYNKDLKDLEFESSPNQAFWYRAAVLSFMWRLRPSMKEKIESEKTRLGYRKPVISIHVRRGDACSSREVGGARQCYHLEAYLAEAVKMRDRYGINRIFLATDDTASVEWARANPSGFEWIIPNMDRSKYVSDTLIEQRLLVTSEMNQAYKSLNEGLTLTLTLTLIG